MRTLAGLLWALGGGVAGLLIGLGGSSVFASVTNMSTREGGRGYFIIAIGLLGAIIGVIAGIVLYGRSAPSGQGVAYSGSGALGVVGLIAAIALGLWAFMQLREAPLMYGNAQASLELEMRVRTADIPNPLPSRWMDIEVQTAKTRPVATPSWSSKRVEGEYTIIPASQSPLYRSGSRVIVVTLGEQQIEVFTPPMKRTPNPKADWSEWYKPVRVDPPYGVTPPAPLKPMFELRYKVTPHGQ